MLEQEILVPRDRLLTLMSRITEKRVFKIPPCQVDKDLIRKIGEFLEKERETLFKMILEETKEKLREEDYYKKYPKELTKETIESRMYGYGLSYSLESSSRNIESSNIDGFIGAEWPENAEQISIELGDRGSPKRVHVTLHLKRSRMGWSEVTVSGYDSTWVNGAATRLEKAFESKRLSYSLLVTHSGLRVILSLVAWASLSFAVLRPLWPFLVPFLREGVDFVVIYAVIFLAGCFLAVWPLEAFLSWLFPRFEYGKSPTPRRVRAWIWGLFLGSGILSALFLRLLGL